MLCNKSLFFYHKKIENRKELDYDIVDGECESDTFNEVKDEFSVSKCCNRRQICLIQSKPSEF